MSDPVQPTDLQSPPWQPGTRLLVGVLVVLFGLLILYLLRSLVVSFTIAFLIAYMLHPSVNLILRKTGMRRGLAALLVMLAFVLIVIGITTGLGFTFSQRVITLAQYLASIAEQLPSQIANLANLKLELGPWMLDFSTINLGPTLNSLASSLSPLLSQAGTVLGSVALAAASAVTGFLLIMVISFYLLIDFNLIRPTLLSLAPSAYQEDANFLLTETNHIWRAFLRGQVFLGGVIGVIVAISMLIVGLDFPIVLGLIAGLLELVPMFGPVISALVAVLVALFQPSNPFMLTPFAYALLIVAIFTIIQQVENTVLVPRIMGESLNLRPLVVFMAVLAGGALAGIFGILLASPFVATMRLYLSYVYSKVVDKPGRPSPALEPRVGRGRFHQARTSLSSLARRLRERSTSEQASDE